MYAIWIGHQYKQISGIIIVRIHTSGCSDAIFASLTDAGKKIEKR